MTPTVEVAVYQQAKEGNYYCGDSYIHLKTDNEFICAIADGLGSGEYALESSQITIDIIRQNIDATVEELVRKCNKKLMGKRGVVLGILKISFNANTYSFSSIGNIGVMTVTPSGKKKRNIPSGGYLAGYERPFKVIREKLLPKMNFILFSDGVTDEELASKFFLGRNVDDIINSFKKHCHTKRKDDTTLIAVSFEN